MINYQEILLFTSSKPRIGKLWQQWIDFYVFHLSRNFCINLFQLTKSILLPNDVQPNFCTFSHWSAIIVFFTFFPLYFTLYKFFLFVGGSCWVLSLAYLNLVGTRRLLFLSSFWKLKSLNECSYRKKIVERWHQYYTK